MYLGNILPVIFFCVELDHVAVDHFPDFPRAVPVAPSHAITSFSCMENTHTHTKPHAIK